jgi:hypothetical protein
MRSDRQRPYFEMADGRTLAAGDGADAIEPGDDGRSLRATWRRFAIVGDKTGALVEPGFELSIVSRIEGTTLIREETLTAHRDVGIRRWSWRLASSATKYSFAGGAIRLDGPDGTLDVRTGGDLPVTSSILSVGDEPLGRGPRVPVPTHVVFEGKDIRLRPGQPCRWEIRLTPSAATGRSR